MIAVFAMLGIFFFSIVLSVAVRKLRYRQFGRMKEDEIIAVLKEIAAFSKSKKMQIIALVVIAIILANIFPAFLSFLVKIDQWLLIAAAVAVVVSWILGVPGAVMRIKSFFSKILKGK